MRWLVLIAIPLHIFAGYTILLTAPDTESNKDKIRNGLLEFTGDFDKVDWWNMNTSGQPALQDIIDYDALVTWSSNHYPFPEPAVWGDTLADYVDGGGRVIICTYAFYGGSEFTIGGRILEEGYSPLLPETGTHNQWDEIDFSNPDEEDHPIIEGTNYLGSAFRDYVALADWGNLVVHWGYDGEEAVAYNDSHTVVSISCYAGHAGSYSDWDGDYPLLMRNALVWICQNIPVETSSIGEVKSLFH